MRSRGTPYSLNIPFVVSTQLGDFPIGWAFIFLHVSCMQTPYEYKAQIGQQVSISSTLGGQSRDTERTIEKKRDMERVRVHVSNRPTFRILYTSSCHIGDIFILPLLRRVIAHIDCSTFSQFALADRLGRALSSIHLRR